MVKFIQKLHRIAGVAAILVVLSVTITGLFLNHTDWLGLHERYAEGPFYMGVAGIGHGDGMDGGGEPPTWERVVIALHSGRVLGASSGVFLDVTGAALVLLSLSGLYLWIRRGNLFKLSREGQAEDAFIDTAVRLVKAVNAAKGLKRLVAELKDVSEHVHTQHIQGHAGGLPKEDVEDVRRHFVELEDIMGRLIDRLEGFEKRAGPG